MTTWQQAVREAVVPGLLAGAATSALVAVRSRRETGSGIAGINATSHFLWGDEAALVERPTLRHTAVGYLTNTLAAVFWATVMHKIFGAYMRRRGLPAVALGSAATAAAAYVTDYHLVPRRLTPGYELRVTDRSLFLAFGVLALTMAAGVYLSRHD